MSKPPAKPVVLIIDERLILRGGVYFKMDYKKKFMFISVDSWKGERLGLLFKVRFGDGNN